MREQARDCRVDSPALDTSLDRSPAGRLYSGVRPLITVVNPHHWLQDDDSFPEDPRLRSRMIRVAQCIEYGGPLPRGHTRETLVPCRRRPGRQACTGLLWVLKQSDDAIHAFCRVCEADEFLIYEWEDTIWAEGPMESVDIAALVEERGESPREPEPGDRDVALRRVLEILGSALTADQVARIIQRSEHPNSALQAILASATSPPSSSAMERLLPVLMNMWNTLPRDELGGRSPEEMLREPGSDSRTGRNEPCPCGSGKKFKKCCLAKTLH